MKADVTDFGARLEEGELAQSVSVVCHELLAATTNATLKDLAELYGGRDFKASMLHAHHAPGVRLGRTSTGD